MSYLSIEFNLLFILFFALYWGCQRYPKQQNLLLLIASYGVVYSFHWSFLLILLCYTVLIYGLSIIIWRCKSPNNWLIFGLVIAIGNLAVFKYFDFFRIELQQLLNVFNVPIFLPVLSLIMPIGISFYTFHSVSYLVSVKKREIQPARFWDIALFLSFFPSIIAGPINRAKDFLPQITTVKPRHIIEYHRALTLMMLAIVKVYWLNAVIAENWVDPIFASPMEYDSLSLLLGLYGYTIQIYLNFSGYIDLVTGFALLLGFTLPINFNTPYLAINLHDFWRRWHITLSTWIRDYVYIPLGGNRISFSRTQINVMIAMLLSGLWHGAGLNFVIWGAIHGIGVVILNLIGRHWGYNFIAKHSIIVARLITLHYVCFAWLFFRSDSFADAIDYLSALVSNFPELDVLNLDTLLILMWLLVFYLFYPLITKGPDYFACAINSIPWYLLPIILVFLLWIVISLAPSGIPNFIYANF